MAVVRTGYGLVVPPGPRNSALTRVQPFFEQAFVIDSTGAAWLPKLLAASPRGRFVLPEVIDEPGGLLDPMLGPHPNGKVPRACFELRVAAPVGFLRWCIDNPDKLSWPRPGSFSPETTVWRRALIFDEPPGRRRAQEEAHRLLMEHSPRKRGSWWRFEGESSIDCVIETERLVVTVEGKRMDVLSAATDWYGARTQLVRNLEAARELANGRRWGTILVSEKLIAEGSIDAVAASVDNAAPHLSKPDRARLEAAYLGNITWRQACNAAGIAFDSLPDAVSVGGSAIHPLNCP